MVRGSSRRTWVKLYVAGWLGGSIRWQLEPDERSVWADLLCLAAECGMEGKLVDHEGKPYPMGFLANRLNITPELLARTIARCKEDKRIGEVKGILAVSNWKVYQSEYERKAQYKKQTIVDKGGKF